MRTPKHAPFNNTEQSAIHHPAGRYKSSDGVWHQVICLFSKRNTHTNVPKVHREKIEKYTNKYENVTHRNTHTIHKEKAPSNDVGREFLRKLLQLLIRGTLQRFNGVLDPVAKLAVLDVDLQLLLPRPALQLLMPSPEIDQHNRPLTPVKEPQRANPIEVGLNLHAPATHTEDGEVQEAVDLLLALLRCVLEVTLPKADLFVSRTSMTSYHYPRINRSSSLSFQHRPN
jgi:hypothetical protein